MAAGRNKAAERVLGDLMPGDDAKAKLGEIRATLLAGHRPGFRDILTPAGRVHPVVWAGLAIAAFQQLVGINVVFYYGEVLWKAAGFAEADALKINVISGVVNIGSTLVAIALVDRWGRRPLLVTGSVGMSVFLGVLAVVFGRAEVAADGRLALGPAEGWVALVSANLYIVCFGMSWGPVMWVLLGEMFPNRMRGSALALAGLCQWLANFAVTMTFPVLLGVVGLGGAYGVYAGFAVFSLAVVLGLVRETKGRSLEEMG